MKIIIKNHITGTVNVQPINNIEDLQKLIELFHADCATDGSTQQVAQSFCEYISGHHLDAHVEDDLIKTYSLKNPTSKANTQALNANTPNLDLHGPHVQSIEKNGSFIHTYERNPDENRKITTHIMSNSQDPKKKGIASINLITYKESPATIQTSFVAKEHRGKGLGLALYQHALNHHKSLESDIVVSPAANSIWHKLGAKMGAERTKERNTLSKSEDKTGHTMYNIGDGYTIHHNPYKIDGHDLGEKPKELKKEPADKSRQEWKIKKNGRMAGHISVDAMNDFGPSVMFSALHPNHYGKGLGTKAYKALANHYGSLHSDTARSTHAEKLWNKIGKHDNKLGRYVMHGDNKKAGDVKWLQKEPKLPPRFSRDPIKQSNALAEHLKISNIKYF